MSAFDDVLSANAEYADGFAGADLTAPASRHLAVVTCMDSRIDPLAVLGLQPGDAKLLRNPGGRVTDEVLVALVLAVHLLDVQRVLVLGHTGCKMASAGEDDVHAVMAGRGLDTRSLTFGTIADQQAQLAADVQRIRSSPYLPGDMAVAGGLYDVTTGRVQITVPD